MPWSPVTHELWPTAARAFVRELLHVGRYMRMPCDVWVAHVLPRVVRRGGPIPRCEGCECAPCACGEVIDYDERHYALVPALPLRLTLVSVYG